MSAAAGSLEGAAVDGVFGDAEVADFDAPIGCRLDDEDVLE